MVTWFTRIGILQHPEFYSCCIMPYGRKYSCPAGLRSPPLSLHRYEQLQTRHEDTAKEVQDLRYVVASLFNAAPGLFSALEPNRLRRIGFIPNGATSTSAEVSSNAACCKQ